MTKSTAEMMKVRSEVCKAQMNVRVKKKRVTYLSFQSNSGIDEPLNRRDGGHNISRIKVPIDKLSRSPQEAQKPQSQSQSQLSS